jgi:putative membrane protein
MFRGIAGPLAAASIIVDILIQAGTQFLFACLGVAVLVALGVGDGLTQTIASALAVAALLLAGFYLAQRRAGQRMLQWIMNGLTGDRQWRVLGTIDAVYGELAAIYAGRGRLFLSTVVHMIGWLLGVAEVLIVLAFMGHPIGLGEAIVIESLLHAVRGAAFAVPGALGAQEGGLVLLCALFGIPPEQAIALSLVKRVPDLILGVPSLLAWQLMEWRRLQTRDQ